ncbi:AcrR family transcriptional regulator [Microbacteriaceae bacterium SG_E_30_P1]|uniref:AcrR family transcriptional regulator n=1 Tax=Antiquaquibacter oligotrophicus TaxID=2880260 RepID=A0ABT6KKN0_9MICO|nr:TetR/AcrR family transcriptional regulator [Antiquaquibacter oligotrophicus]MDH6180296.1 AcrR family transcriptional regulator [Antiquaquibacter oligotrophicus]UDF13957.1 TetR/AcrR family transcriptional regulator [Antiquaquibacter oligotrophicus]
MDARQRRSRLKLHAAVFELAADRRADDLTVAEVARLAGVHRSTFYEHAESPAALLTDALRAELDEARTRHLSGLDARSLPAALRDVTLAVLEHVERHAAIYRRGLADGGPLHDFLSAHFQASSRLLVTQGLLEPPAIPGIPSSLSRDAALRYVADGTVGAISVWLADPRDPHDFLAVLTDLTPPWWPAHDHPSVGRETLSRSV